MSVLERVPLGRIEAEAREVRIGRTLLTLVMGMFWLIGWTARMTVGLLALAVSYVFAAVKLGWQEAGGKNPRERKSL